MKEAVRKSTDDERRPGTDPQAIAFETAVSTTAPTSECFCLYLCCGLSIHHVASPIVDIVGTRRKTSPRGVCDTAQTCSENAECQSSWGLGQQSGPGLGVAAQGDGRYCLPCNFAFPSLKC